MTTPSGDGDRNTFCVTSDEVHARCPMANQVSEPMRDFETSSVSASEAGAESREPQVTTNLVIGQIWRDILSLRSVDPDENFVAAGGDSLLAMQVLARIQRACGVELSMRTILYDAPTIRALAARVDFIKGQDSAPSEGYRPTYTNMVELSSGGRGSPLFLIHPSSGHPWCYIPLTESAGWDRPLFSCRALDLDWERDVLDIQEMALQYLIEMKRIQPTGPYLLGGWCFGGLVALEMAIRLITDGHQVQHLVLFDTPPPSRSARYWSSASSLLLSAVRAYSRAGGAGRRTVSRLGWRTQLQQTLLQIGYGPLTSEELRNILAVAFSEREVRAPLRELSFDELSQLIGEQLRAISSEEEWREWSRLAPAGRTAQLLKAWKLRRKNEWLRLRYWPSATFTGRLTIYATSKNVTALNWRRFTSAPIDVRRFPIVPVHGTAHDSLFEPMNVALFADDLASLLRDPVSPAR